MINYLPLMIDFSLNYLLMILSQLNDVKYALPIPFISEIKLL